MSTNLRRAFLLGCFAITALAGPRTAVDLWKGLRGPYVDAPSMEVAAETAQDPIREADEVR